MLCVVPDTDEFCKMAGKIGFISPVVLETELVYISCAVVVYGRLP